MEGKSKSIEVAVAKEAMAAEVEGFQGRTIYLSVEAVAGIDSSMGISSHPSRQASSH